MTALLIVDLQNDFCPGGALPVPQGNEIVPFINAIMVQFDFVIASKDWHPEKTVHFKKWPVHCVCNTPGAEFHPDLDTEQIDQIFLKGTGDRDDGYSAFKATNLDLTQWLQNHEVTSVTIVGLATDYCVKTTALDCVKKGFKTLVLTSAIRAVNIHPYDGAKALDELTQAGVEII
ncbi:MAG: nicotinamidase [Fidelibacterota bacterium]